MTEFGTSYVRVRANTSGLRGEVESGVRGAFSHVRNIVGGAFAAGGAFEVVKHIAEAAADQQEELALVRQTVKQTSAAWEEHGETVDEVLVGMAKRFGFTVGELAQAFTRIQLGTKDTGKTLDVLGVAMDISRARHTQLASAAVIMSRAVQGNVMGLSRMGIVLKKTHPEYDALKRSYDVAAAAGQKFNAQQKLEMKDALAAAKLRDDATQQTDALAQVKSRVGGAAQTYAGTAKGAFKRFKENLNEFEVSLGTILVPFLTRLGSGLAGVFDKVEVAVKILKTTLTPVFDIMGRFATVINRGGVAATLLKGALTGVVTLLVAQKIAAGLATVATFTQSLAQSALAAAMGTTGAAAAAEAVATATAAAAAAELAAAEAAVALAVAEAAVAAEGGALAQAQLTVATLASAAAAEAATLANEELLIAEEAAMAATPWGLILLGITAVIGGLVALYRHNKTFHDFVVKTWGAIRDSIRQAVTDITALWDKWGDGIMATVGVAFGFVKQTVENAMRTLRGIFQIFHGLLTGDFHEVWAGIKNVVGAELNQLTMGLRAALPGMKMAAVGIGKAILSGILDPIANLAEWVADKIADLGKAMAKGAVDAYHWGVDLAKNILQGIYDNLPTTRLGNFIGKWLNKGVNYANEHVGSTLAEFSGRVLGSSITDGTAAGVAAGSGKLQGKLQSTLRTVVQGVDFGTSIVDQIQAKLDNLDTSALATKLATVSTGAAAAAVENERKNLQDALDKAAGALTTIRENPAGFSEGIPALREWSARKAEAEKAVAEAEAALERFNAQQKTTQLTGTLAVERASLEAQLATQQALDAARTTLQQATVASQGARQAAADAASSLTSAIQNVSQVGFDSMFQAMGNLRSMAGSLGSVIGQYLDEHLSQQLTSLHHGRLGREISALDKQLRVQSEKDARTSARQGITDARREFKERTAAVKTAQGELAALLRAGPKKGTTTKSTSKTDGSDPYSQVVFPDDPQGTSSTSSKTTGGETQAEYNKRVAAARKAVADAADAATSSHKAIADSEAALNTLLLSQKRDRLARELTARETELRSEEEAQKKSVNRQLNDLTEMLNTHKISYATFVQRVNKLVGGDVATYRNIASTLGLAVANEFWGQLKGLGFQAAAIVAAPAIPHTGHEPTITVPLNAINNSIVAVEKAKKARDDADLAVQNAILAEQQATNALLAAQAKASAKPKPKSAAAQAAR